MRIAHLSDLHFSKVSLSPSQFFSKRWLGNLNYLLFRRKEHQPARLEPLISLFQELGVTHLFITGDLSTTSQSAEFEMARKFVDTVKDKGIQVFTVPGNHDHYTKKSWKKKSFYSWFDASFGKSRYNLRDHGITALPLNGEWWMVALDTAIATALHLSTGYFSEELEKRLVETLDSLPKDQKVILINHFPVFDQDGPRKRLKRAPALLKLLSRHPSVKLYLHGHTHRHCIADLQKNSLPIILDAGSTTAIENGGWHLIDLQEKGYEIKRYQYKGNGWVNCGREMV